MTNTRQYWTPYLGPFSNVETFHQGGGTPTGFGQFPALFDGGEIGTRVIATQAGLGSKQYQLCQIDSGATSSTPAGAIAQGQVMYWKDRTRYIVTNDSRFSDASINGTAGLGAAAAVSPVAGVLVTPTSGATGTVAVPGDAVYLQQQGLCTVLLVASGGPGVSGDWLVPNASATVPQAAIVIQANAPGAPVIGQVFNRVSGTGNPSSGTLSNAILQITGIP
jgi:hypothetical protein